MPIIPDHENLGWLRGWGAVRREPWQFVGLFGSKQEAEAECAKHGPGYLAVFGSHRAGTDEFVWPGGNRPAS